MLGDIRRFFKLVERLIDQIADIADAIRSGPGGFIEVPYGKTRIALRCDHIVAVEHGRKADTCLVWLKNDVYVEVPVDAMEIQGRLGGTCVVDSEEDC